jgi:hypothetical protein
MKNMKAIKYILALIAGMYIFQSCDLNEQPVFDDKDAFISFRNSALSIGEEKESLEIPILLTSLAGLNGTVEFAIDPEAASTAVEGVNYRILNDSHTLTFTHDNPTQIIKLEIIDNNTFDGDVKLTFVIKSPASGLNLGFEKTCAVTITDDEHPLLFILGAMQGSGESYFDGAQTWNLTFAKDNDDISKVWITNLVPGGSSASTPVYGVVNAEKTEIRIPVNQIVAVSTSYPLIRLEGFYGPDGAESIPDGGYITGEIAEDGTITLLDEFGSHVWSDANATASAGWYNIFVAGATIKKTE